MLTYAHRCSPALAFLVLTTGFSSARADPDEEDVKERLSAMKQNYTSEAEKFKKAVADLFDKHEEAARAKGDKKLVDQILADRKAFELFSHLPPVPAAVREPVVVARTRLDKTYTEAVKNFVRLKKDAAAQTAEKDQLGFYISSGILVGKKKYLVTLKHSHVRAEQGWFTNNGAAFTPNGTPLKLNGELAPHSIFLHPPPRGASQVRYPVDGKWSAFRTTVGVPTIGDAANPPASPLTFEILGDDKSLWKSKPVTKRDDLQSCDIKLEKVKALTLRVHCPGSAGAAQAVWFEPVLVE
ncbi:MAG: hypothetical protein JWO38_4657 [Gemmataceae bacterium]|nr:hypothetical protein [Gemmataceae bacterium]